MQVLFLPPLLWALARRTSWGVIREQWRTILLLSVVLVVLTTAGVGVAAYFWLPGIGLAGAILIGAAIAPLHGRMSAAILAAAEGALAQASPEKGVTFAAHRLPSEIGRGTDDILAALDANEIVLALQPIVHAGTRQTAFHEGLVRIARPGGDIIMPDALVPDAEKRGIISLLDRRVVELAFALLTSDRSLHLFVNASVISLGDPRWVDQLRTGCRLRPDAARPDVVPGRTTAQVLCQRIAVLVPPGRRLLKAL